MRNTVTEPAGLAITGTHGYSVPKNPAAGTPVSFHISSDRNYDLEILELCPREAPFNPKIVAKFPRMEPQQQVIRPGSFLRVDLTRLEAALKGGAFSIEIWLRQINVRPEQAIVSLTDGSGSTSLCLLIEKGIPLVELSDAYRRYYASQDYAIAEAKWTHLVVTCDRRRITLFVNGNEAASIAHAIPSVVGPLLLVGASSIDGYAARLLDGDIAAPALYGKCLSRAEVAARYAAPETHPSENLLPIGFWPLREERGAVVHDVIDEHHGQIINRGCWRIGGPIGHDAIKDNQSSGHGLRLSSDDLYDCGWNAVATWSIPAETTSGMYLARVRHTDSDLPDYHITFIVSPAKNARRKQLCVLCSTTTWLAYGNSQFAPPHQPSSVWPRSARGIGTVNGAPSINAYHARAGGQPSYQIGLRLPWPSASPEANYHPPDANFKQWAGQELQLHRWLAVNDIAFDVYSDFDLHSTRDLLLPHSSVIVAGHSEYWSESASLAVARFLDTGGSAIVLSGNTAYVRVTFDSDMSVMECRKIHERPTFGVLPGMDDVTGPAQERWHTIDNKVGGKTSASNWPSWKLFGLTTFGWGFSGLEDFGHYRLVQDHDVFRTPINIGVERGGHFGRPHRKDIPGPVGHEWDVRVSRASALSASAKSAPQIEPLGIETIAEGIRPQSSRVSDGYIDHLSHAIPSAPDDVVAEMIYWRRPTGGVVFNAGSAAYCLALNDTPTLQGVLANVLHSCGIQLTDQALRSIRRQIDESSA